ncbi:MAG TPA: acyl carrier protein [Candidatus Eisenbacteria bacterium]|nr:acyl carrier protein [Candidatus Eisenbacteria bacterium]
MAESIEEQLRAFIKRKFPSMRSRELTAGEALLANGIIDSLGVLDLVAFIEESFGISVSDEDLVPENFETIERLTAFVESRRGTEKT